MADFGGGVGGGHGGGHSGSADFGHPSHGVEGKTLGHDHGIGGGGHYATSTSAAALNHGLHFHHVSPINMPLGKAVALLIALEAVGVVGGHGEGVHGYQTGTLANALFTAPSHSGDPAASADTSCNFNLSGIKNDDPRAVEVLVWPHGEADVHAEVDRLMEKFGAVRIWPGRQEKECKDVPEDNTAYKPFRKIVSALPFTDPDNPYEKPEGWYDGCNGNSYSSRRSFQLRPWYAQWLPWAADPQVFEGWRTWLTVNEDKREYSLLWKGQRVTYWRTKIQFFVWSKPVDNDYRWDVMLKHRILAEQVARGVLAFLQGRPADPYAKQALLAMPAERFVPPKKQSHVEPTSIEASAMPKVPTAPSAGAGTDEEDARSIRYFDDGGVGPHGPRHRAGKY